MNWLILRGLVREQRHWGQFKDHFETELKTTHPNARVFALDAPGFGTECDRPSPMSVSGIVDDFRGRWLKLKSEHSGEWNVLAISLGGMIALHWCSQYPKDFERLVLVNSSVKGLSPFYRRMKPRNYLRILQLFAEPKISNRERKILELTTNLPLPDLKKRADYHASFALPVRKKDAFSQIIAALRFRVPAQISIPILVLGTRGDTLVDPSCSRKIAEYYQAPLIEHPKANHDLSTDDPEWISVQVKKWLQA